MTRPGTHNHNRLHPGHHYLDHTHHKCIDKEPSYLLYDEEAFNILTESGYKIQLFVAGSCEGVLCGPNEVCIKGCCVCQAGYERDSTGKCIKIPKEPNYEPPEAPDSTPPPVRPVARNPILQESIGYIYTEGYKVINFDPVDPNNVDPCRNVTCSAGEICFNGVCIPDPDIDLCEGVTCPPGEYCFLGNCYPESDPPPERPVSIAPIIQEDIGYIYTESFNVINYDPIVDSPCSGVVCGVGEICANGVCVPDPNYDPCKGIVCMEGRICSNGICVVDPNYNPCEGVVCGVGELCSKGICIPDPNYNPCLNVYCPTGFICVDGVCEEDPDYDPCAGVTCSTGYICSNGLCVRDPQSNGITQENGGLIFTESNLILNYQ